MKSISPNRHQERKVSSHTGKPRKHVTTLYVMGDFGVSGCSCCSRALIERRRSDWEILLTRRGSPNLECRCERSALFCVTAIEDEPRRNERILVVIDRDCIEVMRSPRKSCSIWPSSASFAFSTPCGTKTEFTGSAAPPNLSAMSKIRVSSPDSNAAWAFLAN